MVHEVVERIGNYKCLAWEPLTDNEKEKARVYVRQYIRTLDCVQITIPNRYYLKPEGFFSGSATFVSTESPIAEVMHSLSSPIPYVIVNTGEHFCVAFILGLNMQLLAADVADVADVADPI
jgi:hypothetical protein